MLAGFWEHVVPSGVIQGHMNKGQGQKVVHVDIIWKSLS